MIHLKNGTSPKDDFFISPLTRFAATIRNEADPKVGDQSKNPFDGLDFDIFPDDIRTKMQGAQAAFEETLQSNAKLENARKQAEDWGRQQQSKAAKLESERLKGSNVVTPDEQLFNEFKSSLLEMGLSDEIATAQAKIQCATVKISEKRIGQGLAPLVHSTAGNQAFQLLQQMPQDKYSNVAEIQDTLKSHVQSLVDTGGSITPQVLNTLKEMAVGSYIIRNPNASFGSGTESSTSSSAKKDEKTLPRLDADTARAVALTVGLMGLPKAKGTK